MIILVVFRWVLREVWLRETNETQKRLHKLLNSHINVVLLCCDWDSDPPSIVVRDKCMFFAWNRLKHHIIPVRRRGTTGPTAVLPASCLQEQTPSPWREQAQRVGTDGWVAAAFPHINSAFFKLISRHLILPHYCFLVLHVKCCIFLVHTEHLGLNVRCI